MGNKNGPVVVTPDGHNNGQSRPSGSANGNGNGNGNGSYAAEAAKNPPQEQQKRNPPRGRRGREEKARKEKKRKEEAEKALKKKEAQKKAQKAQKEAQKKADSEARRKAAEASVILPNNAIPLPENRDNEETLQTFEEWTSGLSPNRFHPIKSISEEVDNAPQPEAMPPQDPKFQESVGDVIRAVLDTALEISNAGIPDLLETLFESTKLADRVVSAYRLGLKSGTASELLSLPGPVKNEMLRQVHTPLNKATADAKNAAVTEKKEANQMRNKESELRTFVANGGDRESQEIIKACKDEEEKQELQAKLDLKVENAKLELEKVQAWKKWKATRDMAAAWVNKLGLRPLKHAQKSWLLAARLVGKGLISGPETLKIFLLSDAELRKSWSTYDAVKLEREMTKRICNLLTELPPVIVNINGGTGTGKTRLMAKWAVVAARAGHSNIRIASDQIAHLKNIKEVINEVDGGKYKYCGSGGTKPSFGEVGGMASGSADSAIKNDPYILVLRDDPNPQINYAELSAEYPGLSVTITATPHEKDVLNVHLPTPPSVLRPVGAGVTIVPTPLLLPTREPKTYGEAVEDLADVFAAYCDLATNLHGVKREVRRSLMGKLLKLAVQAVDLGGKNNTVHLYLSGILGAVTDGEAIIKTLHLYNQVVINAGTKSSERLNQSFKTTDPVGDELKALIHIAKHMVVNSPYSKECSDEKYPEEAKKLLRAIGSSLSARSNEESKLGVLVTVGHVNGAESPWLECAEKALANQKYHEIKKALDTVPQDFLSEHSAEIRALGEHVKRLFKLRSKDTDLLKKAANAFLDLASFAAADLSHFQGIKDVGLKTAQTSLITHEEQEYLQEQFCHAYSYDGPKVVLWTSDATGQNPGPNDLFLSCMTKGEDQFNQTVGRAARDYLTAAFQLVVITVPSDADTRRRMEDQVLTREDIANIADGVASEFVELCLVYQIQTGQEKFMEEHLQQVVRLVDPKWRLNRFHERELMKELNERQPHSWEGIVRVVENTLETLRKTTGVPISTTPFRPGKHLRDAETLQVRAMKRLSGAVITGIDDAKEVKKMAQTLRVSSAGLGEFISGYLDVATNPSMMINNSIRRSELLDYCYNVWAHPDSDSELTAIAEKILDAIDADLRTSEKYALLDNLHPLLLSMFTDNHKQGLYALVFVSNIMEKTGDSHDGEWRARCTITSYLNLKSLSKADVANILALAGLKMGANIPGAGAVASQILDAIKSIGKQAGHGVSPYDQAKYIMEMSRQSAVELQETLPSVGMMVTQIPHDNKFLKEANRLEESINACRNDGNPMPPLCSMLKSQSPKLNWSATGSLLADQGRNVDVAKGVYAVSMMADIISGKYAPEGLRGKVEASQTRIPESLEYVLNYLNPRAGHYTRVVRMFLSELFAGNSDAELEARVARFFNVAGGTNNVDKIAEALKTCEGPLAEEMFSASHSGMLPEKMRALLMSLLVEDFDRPIAELMTFAIEDIPEVQVQEQEAAAEAWRDALPEPVTLGSNKLLGVWSVIPETVKEAPAPRANVNEQMAHEYEMIKVTPGRVLENLQADALMMVTHTLCQRYYTPGPTAKAKDLVNIMKKFTDAGLPKLEIRGKTFVKPKGLDSQEVQDLIDDAILIVENGDAVKNEEKLAFVLEVLMEDSECKFKRAVRSYACKMHPQMKFPQVEVEVETYLWEEFTTEHLERLNEQEYVREMKKLAAEEAMAEMKYSNHEFACNMHPQEHGMESLFDDLEKLNELLVLESMESMESDRLVY